jgi:heme-degrading monooxygenase HmoA
VKFSEKTIGLTKHAMEYVKKHENDMSSRTITVLLRKDDDFFSSAVRAGSDFAWYSDEADELLTSTNAHISADARLRHENRYSGQGKVPPPRKKEFEDGYSSIKTSSLPQGLERSFLLRSTRESGTYIIETIWSSREALDAMRSSGKPKAVALFEQVGVSPTVEIHEVAGTVP